MEIKERLRFFFQNRGYDLKRIKGFNDDVEVIIKALNRQDALCALDLYSDLNIPILGGMYCSWMITDWLNILMTVGIVFL